MDKRIREAIAKHEDFQRLQEEFSLDFIVACLLDARKSDRGTAKVVGRLLREHGPNPSLFISEILYHEGVELEEFRKLGYSDDKLGDTRIGDPNYEIADNAAKRKELRFMQYVGNIVLGEQLPFLALAIGTMGPGTDYQIPVPPYDIFFKSVQRRISDGITEYKNPFTLENVESILSLFRLGGDKCAGEETALSYARDYIAGRKPAPPRPVTPPWAF